MLHPEAMEKQLTYEYGACLEGLLSIEKHKAHDAERMAELAKHEARYRNAIERYARLNVSFDNKRPAMGSDNLSDDRVTKMRRL